MTADDDRTRTCRPLKGPGTQPVPLQCGSLSPYDVLSRAWGPHEAARVHHAYRRRCGALIENEVALKTDPVLRDIEVLIDERMIMLRAEAAE